MKNKKAIGMILSALFVLGIFGVGILRADTATVIASYESTYKPATCVLSVASAGPTIPAVLNLSTGSGTLYVQNIGTPDSLSTPSTMPVSVGFKDNGQDALTTYGGWYQGSSWVSGITTSWSATGTGGAGVGPWTLLGMNHNTWGPAYSALASNQGWQPIGFTVAAPPTLPSGTYNQQIVITGTC